MGLFGVLGKKKRMTTKKIILPKTFMKEFNKVKDSELTKELFQGYKFIEKDSSVRIVSNSKGGIVDETTNIFIMELNKDTPCGFIFEKNYYYFFVEVFATIKHTKEKVRAGIHLVRFDKKQTLVFDEKEKSINVKISGGEEYGFLYFDFQSQSLRNIVHGYHLKEMKWYLSLLSQFLDIFGLSQISPSKWKPK